jgi:integrase
MIQANSIATYQQLKSAVAGRKPGRFRFGKGLYAIVTATGNAAWRCNYLRDGRNQVATLGHFPAMGVKEAEAARVAVRHTVQQGGDPGAAKHAAKVERKTADTNTVEAVGRAWIAAKADGWTPTYKVEVERRLRLHVLPKIGDVPVKLVDAKAIEDVVLGVRRFRAQAVHVRQHLGGLFRYAVAHRMVAFNPVQEIAEYLPKRVRGDERERPQAAVRTIEGARAILAAVEAVNALPSSLLSHRLIALTAVRKREATEAEWSEVDFQAATWTIPARRMKGRRGQKRDHVVTLAPQALEVLQAARRLAPAGSALVFPATRGQALDHSALNALIVAALARAGLAGRHTVHGWRSTFSTILNEADPTNYRIIDIALAHKAFGAVEAHYNRAEYLAERRRIACVWADLLMVGAPSAFALVGLVPASDNVIKLRRAA